MLFNQFAVSSKASKAAHASGSTAESCHNHSEDLYNIDQEIEQLKEIKDIQDELHILSVLLESQISVLKEAAAVLKPPTELFEERIRTPTQTPKIGLVKEPEVAPYSAEKDFNKLHLMIVEQDKRLKALEGQAERANNAVSPMP